jgi:hypothetical protein
MVFDLDLCESRDMSPTEEADSWLTASERARASGDWGEAIACVDRAEARVGALLPLALRRITLLRESARFDEALAGCQSVLSEHPFCADAHLADGFVRLLRGDWREGWSRREWRWRQPEFRRLIPTGLPAWDGGPAPGRRLRVVHEQGLGDLIQFSRYLPAIRQRVGSLVVETPRPLLSLMRASFAEIEFEPVGNPVQADLWVGLMSLPERLAATLQTIPSSGGYLSWPEPDPPIGKGTSERLRIGLAPAGNPGHLNDRFRSIPAASWAPLSGLTGVEWFRVQPEVEERYLPQVPMGSPPWPLDDFAATARWMATLDLVVTVDTSVAHLAGALGVPVWILLPFAPDWRWGISGEESYWYRSARLFRQDRAGDWAPVLDALVSALQLHPNRPHGH